MAESTAYQGAALTTIDPKGRLAIPAVFRNPIMKSSEGERLVCLALNSHVPCLQGYGTIRRDRLLAQVERREDVAVERGEIFRSELEGGPMFSLAYEISFDASGRLILPPILRAAAGIDDKVFFNGNGTEFSIWNPDKLLAQTDPRLAPQQFAARWLLEEGGKA
ncbi:MAG: hypothetical protein R3E02_09335 [Blastomonas sp.]